MQKYILKVDICNPKGFSDSNKSKKIVQKIISEIISQKFSIFFKEYEVGYNATFENDNENILTLGTLKFELPIIFKAEFNGKSIDIDSNKEIRTNLYVLYELEHLRWAIKEFLSNLSLCANIAYPGLFFIENAYLERKNKILFEFEDVNPLSMMDLYSDFKKNKWIRTYNITITEVWEWMKNKTSFFKGETKNNIDKSLNAFSYVFGAHNLEELFYAVMALEALYNTNKNITVESQIKTKLFYFFGDTKEMRKRIKTMYDIRSRVLHGDILIPKKICSSNQQATIHMHYYEGDFLYATETAAMLYIATLHLFIKNNSNVLIEKMKLKFE